MVEYVHVGYETGTIQLSDSDGSEQWNVSGNKSRSIAVDENGDVYEVVDGTYLRKESNADGSQIWQTSLSNLSTGRALHVTPNYVYVVGDNSSNQGLLYQVQRNGTVNWSIVIQNSVTTSAEGLITADSQGRPYVGESNGVVEAFDTSGNLRWSKDIGNDCRATVFNPDDGYVYAYEANNESGENIQVFDTTGGKITTHNFSKGGNPLLDLKIVEGGEYYAASGEIIWRIDSSFNIIDSVNTGLELDSIGVDDSGFVYVSGYDGSDGFARQYSTDLSSQNWEYRIGDGFFDSTICAYPNYSSFKTTSWVIVEKSTGITSSTATTRTGSGLQRAKPTPPPVISTATTLTEEAGRAIVEASHSSVSSSEFGSIFTSSTTLGETLSPTVDSTTASQTSTEAQGSLSTIGAVNTDSSSRRFGSAVTESVLSSVPVAIGLLQQTGLALAASSVVTESGATGTKRAVNGGSAVAFASIPGAPVFTATTGVGSSTAIGTPDTSIALTKSITLADSTTSITGTSSASLGRVIDDSEESSSVVVFDVATGTAFVTGIAVTERIFPNTSTDGFTKVVAVPVIASSSSLQSTDGLGRSINGGSITALTTIPISKGISAATAKALPSSVLTSLLLSERAVIVAEPFQSTRAYPRDSYETVGIAKTTATPPAALVTADSPLARESIPRGSGSGNNTREVFEKAESPEENPDVGDNQATGTATTNTASVSVSKNSADGGTNKNDATINDGEN